MDATNQGQWRSMDGRQSGGYAPRQGGGGYQRRSYENGGGRSNGGGYGGRSFGNSNYAGGNGGGSYGSGERRPQNYNSDDRTQINIPSNTVGKVIGRGGARIQEIQSRSGARVKVAKTGNYGGETLVDIFGEVAARQEAERLIMDVVNEPRQEAVY